MAARGYLEGSQMAGTFDLLRAHVLIFTHVGAGWLMGLDRWPSTSWRGTPTATLPRRPPGGLRPLVRSMSATRAGAWKLGSSS
jgi:hypothetical protein